MITYVYTPHIHIRGGGGSGGQCKVGVQMGHGDQCACVSVEGVVGLYMLDSPGIHAALELNEID